MGFVVIGNTSCMGTNTIDPAVLLNNMSEGMIVLNDRDEVVYFNSVTEKFQQVFKNHFTVGTKFSTIVSPERREIVSYILQQVKATHKPQVTEAEYKEPEGRSHFFEITYNPVIDENDSLVQICVVSHEITHQKIFEKRATQLLKEFSDLILNANAVIFGIDSRGYITEWNTECTRITGYSKNDVFAKKLHEFVDGSQVEFEWFMKAVLEGRFTGNYELSIKTRMHEPLIILSNPTLKKNADGLTVGALFVGQDITELSRYRSSLEREVKERTEKLKESLQKEKELAEIRNRFVSIASHEFRMPLSLIRASSLFLKTNTELRKEDLEKIENIDKQVAHMNALLEDVLAVQKESTSIKATEQKIDLIAVLKNIVNEVLIGTGNRNRISFDHNVPVLLLNSDEKLIRNIFINLLTNALKFSPGESPVLLSLNFTRSNIEIKVIDSGIGIDDVDMQHVSEPFYRASNATCIKGTGLGLSIVKKAVHTLSGTFTIKSKVDKGTTVTVSLPQSSNFLNGYLRPFQ
jgi:PAS domain S-box-containing protein